MFLLKNDFIDLKLSHLIVTCLTQKLHRSKNWTDTGLITIW